MTLDELITWSDSQAERARLMADDYERAGAPASKTVQTWRGQQVIHQQIAAHLTALKALTDMKADDFRVDL